MRVGFLGLLTILLAVLLPAQRPHPGCDAKLRRVPAQPLLPYPPPPPTAPFNCDSAGDIVSAATRNCLSKVRLFLENGVSPDWRAEDGFTALMAAAQQGHLEVARTLLDAGANTTASRPGPSAGTSISALCTGARKTEITRLFLERGLLEKLEDSCAYLAVYSEFGEAETVRDLIAAGVDLEKEEYWRRTPLAAAVLSNNYPVIQTLLQAGANPHATYEGNPMLLLTGDPVTTCLVLKYGADPNIRDAERMTPLMWAARLGNETKARLLLEGGADPNLQDESGRTALMHALTGALQLEHSYVSVSSKSAVARTLIEEGADITMRDRRGRDALQYAENNGHHSIAYELRFLLSQ